MADEPLEIEDNGYLKSGFHDISLSCLEEFFVKTIPDYECRNKIFNGYNQLCTMLQSLGIQNFSQWIGGSFVSNKQYPGDIDVVTFISYDELNKLPKTTQDIMMWYLDNRNAKKEFHCDSYLLAVPPKTHPDYGEYVNHRMYWRGVWGFDRNDQSRGILKIIYGRGADNE